MMVVPGWVSVSGDSFSVVGPVVPHCMDSLPYFMSWYRKLMSDKAKVTAELGLISYLPSGQTHRSDVSNCQRLPGAA